MPSYTYVAKRQLKVGDDLRQPGDMIPEASSWPNRDVYVARGDLEAVIVPSEGEKKAAVYRSGPTPPRSYAPEGYDERTPTPVRVGDRLLGDGEQVIRCFNCLRKNHLPEELVESAIWQCWSCHQLQSLREALAYPSPSSIDLTDEWQR